ncbi:unnamed protein product [Chilo suppressalis]|uniref:Uncharacterized protein n=1 Tax=Chilo suppressalis TaxID=168631 RepID=A0ABN8B6F9_CHISP|nr:unnamed protein product [Chilo suppressalis]
MLSRRDKLLIQPWDDRRFKDHRSKVRSALPAIDDRAPTARPHVAVKLKKFQRELDRKRKIQADNYSLLQRLNAIMKAKSYCINIVSTNIGVIKVQRCNFDLELTLYYRQKVGLFYDAVSLNSRITLRSLQDDTTESSYSNVKCYACEVKKRSYDYNVLEPKLRLDSLPSLF